jgi:hypothetical protein
MYSEIWKDIHGYEGLYQVSNYGNIKSFPKKWKIYNNGICGHEEIIMKHKTNSNGYLSVSLYRDKKKRSLNIHRLVLSAFTGISDLQVNHKNGCKRD